MAPPVPSRQLTWACAVLALVSFAAAEAATASILAVTDNTAPGKGNKMVRLDVSSNGSVATTSVIDPFEAWQTNSGAFDSKRKILYLLTREKKNSDALTIVGYTSGGKVTSKVALADKTISSLYAANIDSEDGNIKCILQNYGSQPVSIDVHNGTITKIGTKLLPKTATSDLGTSGFDQATGRLFQLMDVEGRAGDMQDLYTIDTRKPRALGPKMTATDLDPDGFFQSPAFSTKQDALYGMMDSNALGKIDVATGKVTAVGKPVAKGGNQLWGFLHGVVDDDAGLYYTSMQVSTGAGRKARRASAPRRHVPAPAGSNGKPEPAYLIAVDLVTGKLALKAEIDDPLMYMSLL